MAQEVENKLGNLFQGGLSMFSMDLKSTGMTWVDNVYQKLEAMCQEVENIMIQETSKLVENQAQTVGLNVKKFCAEIVQDLIPPSAGSGKESASDLSSKPDVNVVTCKNSKVGLGDYSVNDKPTQGELEISDSSKMDSSPTSLPERPRDEIYEACNAQIKSSILNSVEATEHNSAEKGGKNWNNGADMVGFVAGVSSALPFPESVPSFVCCEDKVEEKGLVQSGGVLSTEINDNFISAEIVSLVRSSGNGHEQHCGPSVLDDFLPPQEIAGRYFDGEEAEEGNAVIEPIVETIDEFEDVTLEESCLDAAGKNEFCYISIRDSKTRSFKKKLCDAVASKMQFAKKLGYEEIAIWYDDVDMEMKQGMETSTSSTLVRNLDRKDVSSSDVCVSDWEFL